MKRTLKPKKHKTNKPKGFGKVAAKGGSYIGYAYVKDSPTVFITGKSSIEAVTRRLDSLVAGCFAKGYAYRLEIWDVLADKVVVDDAVIMMTKMQKLTLN